MAPSKHNALSLVAIVLAVATLPTPAFALEERRVLVEFFEATNGAQWLNKENWGSDGPICSWHGISCLGGTTNSDSEVDTIQLPENNIAGAIPPSLYSLPLLRYLDLEGNPITNAGFLGFQEAKEGQGVSLSPLETLALNGCNLRDIDGIEHAPTSLRDLRLADNNLQGTFPEAVFTITSLRRLFLDQNGITGSIPSTVGNMQNLIDFHAIGVPFSGAIPSEFGTLAKIVTMVMRDNDFVGTIPTELNNMLNLEILSIGRSLEAGQGQLSGPLPSFAQLPYLELLDFSLNKLEGTIPRDFFLNNQRTDDLVIVRLDGNELTGTLPKQLGWIDSMDLGLTGNKLVGPIPQEICEKKQWMTGLVEQFACDAILCPEGTFAEEGKHTLTADCQPCDGAAFLGQTSCGGAGGSSSSGGSQPWQILASLYLALQGESWDNRDGWSAIDTVLNKKKLEDLQATDLDYCSFFGVTCSGTGDIQKLELSDNSLYGNVLASVFTLSTMTTFDVSSNKVSMDQDAFQKIADTNVLQDLILSHTDVNTLSGIKGATSMKNLYLDGISFEAALPDDVFSLSNLQVLEVPNSQLRGGIPTLIGQLHKLQRLELRWNQLTGALPSELGLLTSLQELDLSYNDFTGSLPLEIGSMSNLQELELSRAKRGGLGGELPPLDGLASLEVLGLSHNDFKQSIPASFLSGVADKTKNIRVSLSFNHFSGVIPHQLDVFSSMVLELEGNMIEDLPSVFCDNTFWMEGYVAQATFGCNAILCPPGTYNKNGKESQSSICLPCETNEFYGATSCGSLATDGDAPTSASSPGSAPSTQFDNTPKTEVQILDMFFAATNGNDWTSAHDGWTAGAPACAREGVTCDDDGNIDALRLNRFGLNGQIPTEIFQLSFNRILGFTDNTVDLRFDGIDQSTSLETLLMSNTKLKSLEGLQHASVTLHSIHAARNGLDGAFPKHLLNLPTLEKLFLNQNKFSGTLPTEISSMSTLKDLRLWENRLTGHLPSELGLLGGLEYLDLTKNSLSGPIPEEMGQMTAINTLLLSEQKSPDKLSGPLHAFSSNSLLTSLNVSMNAFAGTIPADMLAAVDKTLEVNVDLSSNKISGEVPVQLGIFEKLNVFLAGNRISSVPSALCSMAGWMSGEVGTLGSCSAILCPPDTFSSNGRAGSGVQCSPCTTGATATYFGSMTCSDNASDSERDILTKFYDTLGGETWLSSFNWKTESGVCTWFGITCNDELSVVEIKLASNQIVGTKDQMDVIGKIFQLPNLQVLDLKGNSVDLDFQQFTFSPSLQSLRVSGTGLTSLAGIGRATNLRRLHATDNMLNGTMPDELFDLPNLRSLYLSFNSLRGTIPTKISQLSSLQEFYMYGNQLTKGVPTEMGLLQNLREIVLARNFISGPIPTEFSSMASLEQLSLYDQQGEQKFSGPLPTFEGAPNLWFFDISSCDLTGTIPNNFMANSIHKNATITLVLKNNQISGTVPASLQQFDALDIDLSGNKIEAISDVLCTKKGWMKGEVEITGSCDSILCPQGYYSENGIQKSTESPCQVCADLKDVPFLGQTLCQSFEGERGALNLLYSAAGGNTWASKDNWASDTPICGWEGIKCEGSEQDEEGITSIKLDKNMLVGNLPTALWSLPKLQSLLLSNNEGLAVSFDGLANAKALEVLQISKTKIDSIDGIAQASSLRELFIDENGLTGTFPREIFDLHKTLEKFRFSANFYYGSLPTEITKMTKMTEFHAANNEFYSTIPSELAQLTNLQSVALNENLFYGALPTELSSMPQLQIFSARRERKSGPKLTGTIPLFDQTPSLTVLFLDGNDLTGSIPADFLKSSSSVYLVDLKNNSLTGAVPESLDNLNELDIRLEGNQIDTLADVFCDNTDWMGGNVGRLKSCDAIMCNPGTANPNGRAVSSPDECVACTDPKAAPFYGSRTCEPVLTDREILVKLYDSCSGGEWKASTNWNSKADICDWHGIGCKDGHVILINLGSNNLSGTPPAELFDLPHLEILWLNSNPISFSFAHLARATSLMDLRVDETSLSSLAGVGAGIFLTSLHLGFNSIGGTFPSELLQLKNIRTLSMNNNGFTGHLPDLSGMEFLRTLRLSDNKFSGSVPAFAGMHILSTVDISGNELEGTIPSNFLDRIGQRLSAVMDLSNNKITGSIPGALARFDDLSLYLRGNKIDGVPGVLCNKPSWMGGDVGKYGCDAILCAPGTSNFDGRHSERSPGCVECPEADTFYGQANCLTETLSRSAADRTGISLIAGILLAVAGIVNAI